MRVAAWLLRVKAREVPETRTLTYESGEAPRGGAWIRFHPRYYVVALVFVLFDVETVFLLPWSLNLREFGMLAILEMCVFLGILLLGWAYALRKGALKWQ
jgi:NADH-quinone oxidoreductase subunit A